MSLIPIIKIHPLPCPFCGYQVTELHKEAAQSPLEFFIRCRCGVLGTRAKSPDEAIANWNCRVPALDAARPQEHNNDGLH